MRSEQKSKLLKLYLPIAIVVLAVLTGVWFWYRDYSSYITTDDAHVDADNVGITSKMLGRIASITVEEGASVKKGDQLAAIDSTDLIAQRDQALALRLQAQTSLSQAEVKFQSDGKSIRVLEIGLERATDDFTRAKLQSEGGVITAEQFDHAKKAFETASAQLDAANAALKVSESVIRSARAAVETASAQVNVLNTQLRNTLLYAPDSGIIAKRWLQSGDVVQPGQSVLTLIKSNQLWVVAYFEETKISEISTGQKVKFTIDAFPGIKFSGTVFLKGSSTASVFSLIPSSNASGNFTKTTQRIPVRISIDDAGNNTELSSLNILSGMSAVVKVIRIK